MLVEVKECYKLDLANIPAGWQEISPMLKGRYNHQMVTAKGLIYAVGGEGPFSEHDDIEVRARLRRKKIEHRANEKSSDL